MNPFEHHPDTPIITGDYDDWLKSMHDIYLDVVSDRTVLEIAAQDGDIAREILKYRPKQLTMVEFDPACKPVAGAEFIHDDVFKWLPSATTRDVVICFGLFYHLHSSLHLLELMVNHCKPQYLLLDSVLTAPPLTFYKEPTNVPGYRWVPDNWKTAPFVMNVSFDVINESLYHMGYDLIKTHKIHSEWYAKSNSWVAQWRAC